MGHHDDYHDDDHDDDQDDGHDDDHDDDQDDDHDNHDDYDDDQIIMMVKSPLCLILSYLPTIHRGEGGANTHDTNTELATPSRDICH